MDDQTLLPDLQAHAITIKTLAAMHRNAKVYIGTWRDIEATIKIYVSERGRDYRKIEKECISLQTLAHPNIVKVYDCFWTNDNRHDLFVLVVELNGEDLYSNFLCRKRERRPWEEAKLWNILGRLIPAFAFMQRQGFAHRDVSPHNLFLIGGTEVKVGEFSSGRFAEASATLRPMALVGTPFYFSPILKQSFVYGADKVTHNVFKSDVYSLGVTLLQITCEYSHTELTNALSSLQLIEGAIRSLQYSEQLQQVLWWMLQWEEESRCDFIELGEWIAGIVEEAQCVHCGVRLTASHLRVKLNCDHQFCSEQCVSAYLDTNNFLCPKCLAPFPPNLSPNPPESPVIVYCLNCSGCVQQSPDSLRLPCAPAEHQFCSIPCIQKFLEWSPPTCPRCNSPFDPALFADVGEVDKKKMHRAAKSEILTRGGESQNRRQRSSFWDLLSLCALRHLP